VSAAEVDKVMFARAMKALGPYLGELVVIGGWAHRLYELHAMACSPGFQPLMTEDADIAAPVKIQTQGESIAALPQERGLR
jgi:Nucleotidyltransferase